jgi:hypothetical protein
LSPTASGANLRGKYQYVGLNLFFKLQDLKSVYKYEKKLDKSKFLGVKIDSESKNLSSNENRNNVWKLKIFGGLKMHCQNKVDGRCVKKELFINI